MGIFMTIFVCFLIKFSCISRTACVRVFVLSIYVARCFFLGVHISSFGIRMCLCVFCVFSMLRPSTVRCKVPAAASKVSIGRVSKQGALFTVAVAEYSRFESHTIGGLLLFSSLQWICVR